MSHQINNPFSIKTPETMTAKEVVDLFVPISEFFDIEETGHVFVHGHRGSGKSMMFRLMAPDCQIIRRNLSLHSLPYFGVYLSIKATELNIPEFNRLEGQLAGYILSEHILVGYLIIKTIQSLSKHFSDEIDKSGKLEEVKQYCKKSIIRRLKEVGWNDDESFLLEVKTTQDALLGIIELLNAIHVKSILYLKRLAFTSEIFPYQGPLLGFQDFLLPTLRDLKVLSFMPNTPFYLLIDDADNLNLQQTKVLNTWVSYRTTADLSLKISTQLNYKTRLTTSEQRIESPHDYSEVTVSDVYTGPAKDKYPQWVENVVGKRLNLANISTDPKNFFPADEKQEQEIAAIAQEYKEKWTPESGGYRPRDDAYRNARPEYIKRLSGAPKSGIGSSKQGYRYKYAGFDQLVHISSGVIRYFLDPASKMFSAQQKQDLGKEVNSISPDIQDRIIRDAADGIMLKEFDELMDDFDNSFVRSPEIAQKMKKLRNLIRTLGALFYEILISDRTERKVFSFAISDDPDKEVVEILRLGVQCGYFYESAIGTKEGMGRTRLYVLTRRLAPFFKLDPTGFSGYKFVTNSFLRAALEKPKTTQNQIRTRGADVVLQEQHSLFDFIDEPDEN